ncbi:hypothetical protein [Cardiobacterium hominis]|jgi:hypothetical protein|uniref:hypothetical protein n=1 Tax=Cardiobacterium hominis TaxID=2718 RepID=UPI00065FAFF2|nr:hypothetical protein [Cardiobacterium hominis]
MNIMNTDLAKEARRVAIPLGETCDYLDISYMKGFSCISAHRGDESISIEIYRRDNGVFHCHARTYSKGDEPVLKDKLLEGGTIGELGVAVREYLNGRKAA